MKRYCRVCSELFEVEPRHGKRRRYCSNACKQRAYRERVALFCEEPPGEIPDTSAPLKSLEEMTTLMACEGEMARYGEEILLRDLELIIKDAQLITEAEKSGRSAWRYCDPDEDEIRDSARVLRAFPPDTLIDPDE